MLERKVITAILWGISASCALAGTIQGHPWAFCAFIADLTLMFNTIMDAISLHLANKIAENKENNNENKGE